MWAGRWEGRWRCTSGKVAEWWNGRVTINTSIYPTMPRVYTPTTPPRLTVALSEPPPQEPRHKLAKFDERASTKAAAKAKAAAKLDAAEAAHKLWKREIEAARAEMKAEEDAGVPDALAARNHNHRKRKIEAVKSVFYQAMAVAEEKEAEEVFYQA